MEPIDVGDAAAHLAGLGRHMLHLRRASSRLKHGSGKVEDARFAAARDVDDAPVGLHEASGVPAGAHDVVDVHEVSGLKTVSEDPEGVSRKSRIHEPRDDRGVLRARVLPGPVHVEEPQNRRPKTEALEPAAAIRLRGGLGCRVRAHGLDRHRLPLRERGLVPIDGACRCKHEFLDAVPPARLQHPERPARIHLVGSERILDAALDARDGRQVVDDPRAPRAAIDDFGVRDVAQLEPRARGNVLDSPGGKVVEENDLVSVGDVGGRKMPPDESGPTRHEDFHCGAQASVPAKPFPLALRAPEGGKRTFMALERTAFRMIGWRTAALALAVLAAGAVPQWVVQGTGENPGPAPIVSGPEPAPPAPPLAPIHANEIVAENAMPGDTWNLRYPALEEHRIKGYARPFSVVANETLEFFVTTTAATFSAEIFRLGWYDGMGARRMTTLGPTTGVEQSGWRTIDPTTGLVEMAWQPALTLTVPPEWTTGVYVVRLTSSEDLSSYIPFVVRPAAPAGRILYHTGEMTWQAYNAYGGASLYSASIPGPYDQDFPAMDRARAVSMDRPFDREGLGVGLREWEIPTIRFLEEQGYAVDYTSGADIDRDPDILLRYDVAISAGHDEYWTPRMRDAFEAARDAGVHLAFFGANAAYMQVRLEASPAAPEFDRRVIVCYRRAALDPLASLDPRNATVAFRSAPVSRPENALLGVMYESLSPYERLADLTFTDAASAIPGGPAAGATARGVVGYEWDRRQAEGEPPGVIVLAQSAPTDIRGHASVQHTTIYRAESGAYVFATGTLGWAYGFEGWTRYERSESVRQMTRAVLDMMLGALDS